MSRMVRACVLVDHWTSLGRMTNEKAGVDLLGLCTAEDVLFINWSARCDSKWSGGLHVCHVAITQLEYHQGPPITVH